MVTVVPIVTMNVISAKYISPDNKVISVITEDGNLKVLEKDNDRAEFAAVELHFPEIEPFAYSGQTPDPPKLVELDSTCPPMIEVPPEEVEVPPPVEEILPEVPPEVPAPLPPSGEIVTPEVPAEPAVPDEAVPLDPNLAVPAIDEVALPTEAPEILPPAEVPTVEQPVAPPEPILPTGTPEASDTMKETQDFLANLPTPPVSPEPPVPAPADEKLPEVPEEPKV